MARTVIFLTSELEGERASSHRQFRWCRFLIEAGFSIEAFTLRGATQISRRVICSQLDLDQLSHDIRSHAKPSASVREGAGIRAARFVKHLLLVDLWLPNVLVLFARLLFRRTKPEAPILLFVSSPPFSVVVIGALLRILRPKRFRLAIDMRDAWARHRALGGIRPIKLAIERLTLRQADACVTVSRHLAREFEQYQRDVQVAYNVATHISDSDVRADRIDWSRLNVEIGLSSRKLVYVGSIPEGFCDLDTFVDALQRAAAAGSLRPEASQIVFVGACDSLQRRLRGCGLERSVIFVPHQPFRVAKLIQANASALLFLGYDDEGNGGVVSTKLFEYLAFGKPIVPLMVRTGSDVDDILSRYGGNRINSMRAPDVAELLIAWERGETCFPQCPDARAMSDLLVPYREFCSYVHHLIDRDAG